MGDVTISRDDHVLIVEIRRGPHNFFDEVLIGDLADAFEHADAEPAVRAILLCAEGKNFCAGADFGGTDGGVRGDLDPAPLYHQALRLFRCKTPVVAAVQGAAVGGGLGLALTADFRVACEDSRFVANFNRIGLHPGFGLTATLPRLIGMQRAASLFYTGRSVHGAEAAEIGLVDRLALSSEEVRAAGLDFAREIAQSAPLAVIATRETLRHGLAEQVAAAVERELEQQAQNFRTDDFREGVTAARERRPPSFSGT